MEALKLAQLAFLGGLTLMPTVDTCGAWPGTTPDVEVEDESAFLRALYNLDGERGGG